MESDTGIASSQLLDYGAGAVGGAIIPDPEAPLLMSLVLDAPELLADVLLTVVD